MRPTIVIGLFVLVMRGALAQAHPDVAEILKRVSETYRAASEYELVGDVTENTGARIHSLSAFKAPNRYRVEGLLGLFNDVPATLVHDGAVLWFYNPGSKEYGSFPSSALTGDGELVELRPVEMDHSLMRRYRGAADVVDGAKFLRGETIEAGGTKKDCYVVSVEGDGTWWIDKKSSRVVRVDDAKGSTVFTTVKLGEPLPDSLFKFEPPPGGKKIEQP